MKSDIVTLAMLRAFVENVDVHVHGNFQSRWLSINITDIKAAATPRSKPRYNLGLIRDHFIKKKAAEYLVEFRSATLCFVQYRGRPREYHEDYQKQNR